MSDSIENVLLKQIQTNADSNHAPAVRKTNESNRQERRLSRCSSTSSDRSTRKRKYPESRKADENGRTKRQCNIKAEILKVVNESGKTTPKVKTASRDLVENQDGSLTFQRDFKTLASLKRISAGAFSWELTHTFTESHSYKNGVPDDSCEIHPIYGVHIAPFTIPDPCIDAEESTEPHYLIATTGSKWIQIYTCTEKSKLKLIQVHSGPQNDNYYNVKFTKFDGIIYLVSAGENGTVRVIDVAKGDLDHSFEGAANPINDIQIHPIFPEVIALASKDMSTHLWNIKSRTEIAIFSGRSLEGHSDQVLTVDFNQDGTKLLSSGMDHNVIIWDLIGRLGIEKEIELSYDLSIKHESSPRLPVWKHFVFLKCSSVHRNYVDCAKFYGNIIISKSCNQDAKVCAWIPTIMSEDASRVKSEVDVLFQYSFPLKPEPSWFMKFSFDSSRRFMAVGLMDGRVMVMDLHSSEDPMDLRTVYLQGKTERQGLIRESCFSPDGKFLISVDETAKVFKYNIKIAQPTATKK